MIDIYNIHNIIEQTKLHSDLLKSSLFFSEKNNKKNKSTITTTTMIVSSKRKKILLSNSKWDHTLNIGISMKFLI